MAKANSARLYGDDYQYLMFWTQACRMFDDRSKVVKVEIESDELKSLDDIVVHYSPAIADAGKEIHKDYYQVKFHMRDNGVVTWENLIDPKFINATSKSFLQRVRDAQLKAAPDGKGVRFYLYSTWRLEGELAELHKHTDGSIDVAKLRAAKGRQKLAKVKHAWKKHLNIADDEELYKTISLLYIETGVSCRKLIENLNCQLQLAGFHPVDNTATHPYCDLCRTFVKTNRVAFSKSDIETVCKEAKLWKGRPVFEPKAKRLGIQSFLRITEHLEDATDLRLQLLDKFNEREIKDIRHWKIVAKEVKDFLAQSTKGNSPFHIHLSTHGSIAFLAGYCCNPKFEVDIAPIQSTMGRRLLWRPDFNDQSPYHGWITQEFTGKKKRSDIAVVISATHDAFTDAQAYLNKNDIPVQKVLHLKLPTPSSTAIKDGTHCLKLAQDVVSKIKEARSIHKRKGRIHLFWAAPNSFAFILGQLSAVIGPCNLYEYDFGSGVANAYVPSIKLPEMWK